MIPVSELRGGMIAAYGFDFQILPAFIICFCANILPVPFMILFIRKLLDLLKNVPFVKKLIEKIETRAKRKSDDITKKSEKKKKGILATKLIGLFLLVAIPIPGTGAWTGAIVADIMNLRMKHSLPVIILGVLTAGIITAAVVYGLVDSVFLTYLFG
jgi:uncharacterized membrane protein